MTYKELQTALKPYKQDGLTAIKLNASKQELEAEYSRLVDPQSVKEKEVETKPRILTIAVNERWFKMIASGFKKEEYRKIEQYYYSRFDKPITHIKFTNGYGKKVPSVTVELLGIGKGIPKPEWSEGEATIEQGTEVFILALGEIVDTNTTEEESKSTPLNKWVNPSSRELAIA